MMKKQHSEAEATPRGASLEKIDVRLRVESKRRLEEIAAQENRSTNRQAVHFIELGISGPSMADLSRKIDNIEAMLAEALKRLGGK